jgi:predicted transposase/invertase (TIGR01784 family)
MNKYHNVFHITEKETGFAYFRDLELHTIELKKFSKNTSEGLEEILSKVKNALDIWIAFLTRRDLLNKDNLPPKLDIPALKKALHVLDVMSFGEEEREAYEAHLKWLRIEANTLKKYKEDNTREIAKRLIKKGLSLEEVCEVTELNIETVEKLAAEIGVSPGEEA